MTYINVSIHKNDKESCEISVENNGKCIPIVKNTTEDIYTPELIFGHLMTGSNFDDSVVNVIMNDNVIIILIMYMFE
jgi:DNA topoisomerase-2